MAIDLNEVKEAYIVSSLVRGFKVLSSFTMNKPELKVSDIAEIARLDQATAYRFVYTLEHLGYLVRDEATKRYHLSVRMLSLCLPARQGISLREVALPPMYELSKRIDESVKLSILDGIETVTVGVVDVLDKLSFLTPIGYRSPAYCTSEGKVLLAYQPIELWNELISQINFVPRTDNTIIDPNEFNATLRKTCNQGFAIQDSEFVIGHGSIAAPIFDRHGIVVGAMSISGLAIQILAKDKFDLYVNELSKTTQFVSNKLGYQAEV